MSFPYFENNLFIFSCLILFFTITTAEWNSKDYLKREHSLLKPYQGAGITIPNWDFLGHTLATSNFIRLTPDGQSKQGAIWNSVPIRLTNWELQIHFQVHGKGKELFGDGMVIWYAKDRMQHGTVFGSKNFFSGLAVVLDTYSNHNGPHNHQHPYVSAMVNNGTLNYDHDKDGTHTQLAGCETKFRNLQHDTHIAIRYEKNTLSVMLNVENKGEWKECVSIPGILLPTGYYIGMSASTGDLSDNHDIISVRMFQLDMIEDEKTIQERMFIIPSASNFEAPRERIEDTAPPSSWGGLKTFLVMMVISIVLISLVVIGIMYYQKQQENSRKRFY